MPCTRVELPGGGIAIVKHGEAARAEVPVLPQGVHQACVTR
jgi:hypothetical protein